MIGAPGNALRVKTAPKAEVGPQSAAIRVTCSGGGDCQSPSHQDQEAETESRIQGSVMGT